MRGLSCQNKMQAVETSVRDAVSTFLSMKPLDIFNETSEHFPRCVFGNRTYGIQAKNMSFFA